MESLRGVWRRQATKLKKISINDSIRKVVSGAGTWSGAYCKKISCPKTNTSASHGARIMHECSLEEDQLKPDVDDYDLCQLRKNNKKLIGVESDSEQHCHKTMHGNGNKCDPKLTGVYDDDDRIFDESDDETWSETAQITSKSDKEGDNDQFHENLSDWGRSFAEELKRANLDRMAVDESDNALIPNLRLEYIVNGGMIMISSVVRVLDGLS